MAIFNSKLSKKHIKELHSRFNWSAYIYKKRKKVIKHAKFSGSLGDMYRFSILTKKVFKSLYFCKRESAFKKLHKVLYKKDKKRLYFQNFFLTLERSTTAILLQSKIISKVKILKKIMVEGKLLINGEVRFNYVERFGFGDFIGIKIPEFDDVKKIDSDVPVFSKQHKKIIKILVKDHRQVNQSISKILTAKIKNRFLINERNKKINIFCNFFFLSEHICVYKFKWVFNKILLKFLFNFFLILDKVIFNRKSKSFIFGNNGVLFFYEKFKNTFSLPSSFSTNVGNIYFLILNKSCETKL